MKKILLLTGASSEVGVSLINNTYQDYHRIYLQYRTMNDDLEQLIRKLEGSIEVIPLQADFSRKDEILKMIEAIRATGVIPNQVVHLPSPQIYNKQFHKDCLENYEQGWNISVCSAVLLLQTFIPTMVKEHYGRIVFMLTSNTIGCPAKYQAGYVTVKYALLGLMKALSAEYADKGITVNGVSPDMMETKFLSEIPELIVEQNRANSPLGRNIYVEEVIPVIQLLLSDVGVSITGENIGITGGTAK